MRQYTRTLGPRVESYSYFENEDMPLGHHGKYSERHSYLFWYMQLFHALIAIGAVVLTAVLYGVVWNCGGDCQYYATNTFLSTSVARDNKGWPVAPDSPLSIPATKTGSWAIAPYYGCMQAAGLATNYCNNNTVDLYTTCLNTNQQTKAALATCTSFTGAYYLSWPTGDQFLSCLWNSPVLSQWTNVQASRKQRNAFLSCMKAIPFPFFETPLGVDTHVFLGSYNWGLFAVVGLAGMTSFSVFTASPFVTGPVIDGVVGCYRKLGVLWAVIAFVWNVALLIITFSLMLASQVVLSGTSLVVIFGTTGVLCVYFAMEISDNWNGRHDNTVHDSWKPYESYKKAASDYEIYDEANKKKIVKDDAERAEMARREAERVRWEEQEQRRRDEEQTPYAAQQLSLLPEQSNRNYYIQNYNPGLYASPLLNVWGDGYVICDFLIWLGIAGATAQVTTDYAWNVFTLIFIFRLNNSNMARLLFECFHSERDNRGTRVDPADKFKVDHAGLALPKDPKEKEPLLDLKVMALSLQVANILFLVALLFVVFDTNQLTSQANSPFQMFVILGFLGPETLRLITHLYCQVKYKSNHGLTLLIAHQFIWNWDIIVRIVIICSIVWSRTDQYAPYGTFGFIKYYSNFLLNNALNYLAPF